MNHFYRLLKYEITLCHRSYHLMRHSAYITLLATIILSIMISGTEPSESLKMLLVIFGSIMASVTVPSPLVKYDMQDGSLENLFSRTSSANILMAKYFAIFYSVGIGILCTFPIIGIFYSLSIMKMLYLAIIVTLMLLQIVAILLLGNIIHAYFRQNTNFILIIIAPLIIPSLILASLAISTMKLDFLLILLGIDMVFVPIILVLSNYLFANLYEV